MGLPVPTVGGAPTAGRRRPVLWLIAAFLVFQVATPLSYYAGDDPYDERFAWRMFSAIRVYRCRPSVLETRDGGASPVRLDRIIHRAWITTLQRNRAGAIRAFLAHRCGEADTSAVVFRNLCVGPDGSHAPPIEWRRDCESREVTEPDHALPGPGAEG